MFSNSNGAENVATGWGALYSNTTGSDNLASGLQALFSSTTGTDDLALGSNALLNSTTGNDDLAGGVNNMGQAGDTEQIRIGTNGTQTAVFIAGVNGTAIPGPTKAVVINARGQLGTTAVGATTLTGDAQASQLSLRDTNTQVRHQQRLITALTTQNRRLATEIAQLKALVVHR